MVISVFNGLFNGDFTPDIISQFLLVLCSCFFSLAIHFFSQYFLQPVTCRVWPILPLNDYVEEQLCLWACRGFNPCHLPRN
jgi:hypothetical protein